MRKFALGVALLAGWVGWSVQGSIYQWAYDRLPLSPGFQAHIFANTMDQEALGLVLELSGTPEQLPCLVFGGILDLSAPVSTKVHLRGRVVSGGLAVVALPEEIRVLRAAWIAWTNEVSIDVESPIPRAQTFVLVQPRNPGVGSEAPSVGILPVYPPGIPLPPMKPPVPIDEHILERFRYNPWWPWPRLPVVIDEELEWLEWKEYPYIAFLSGLDSFSPLEEEIVSWTWTWEDGVVQAGPVILRAFNAPGWYWVTLAVQDKTGREQRFRLHVYVSPAWEELEPVEVKPMPVERPEIIKPGDGWWDLPTQAN